MSENQEQKSQPNNTKAGDALNRQITVDGSMMVVQEVRTVRLKKGCNIVQAEGVPNNVNKSSIMAIIHTDKPGSVKSKTFRPAESLTPQRVLDELIAAGAKVDVNYTTPHRLQTYNANRILCGDPNEFVIARPNGETMICRNPEAIHTKHPLRDLREIPALEFKIESSEDQEVDIFILFHANQSLSCPVSHNLIFDEEQSVITSLESSVLVSNSSGCNWSNVTLKIMTGKQAEDPSRQAKSNRSMLATASFAADSYSLESAGGGAAAESVGERKLFELPPGLDLANGESNLVTLNLATGIPAQSEYFLSDGVYRDQPVNQKISFKNLACEKSSGMGKPIAAGSINFYQRDKSGSLQLVSNRLQMPDTPVGQTIPLQLGGTQDIKASRLLLNQEDVYADKDGKPLSVKAKTELEKQLASQTNCRHIQQNVIRTETFEVSISNFKSKPVEVAVVETLGGNQKILKPSSFKLDASTRLAKTIVKLAARTEKAAAEQKLTYVIETRYTQTLRIGDVDSK